MISNNPVDTVNVNWAISLRRQTAVGSFPKLRRRKKVFVNTITEYHSPLCIFCRVETISRTADALGGTILQKSQ